MPISNTVRYIAVLLPILVTNGLGCVSNPAEEAVRPYSLLDPPSKIISPGSVVEIKNDSFLKFLGLGHEYVERKCSAAVALGDDIDKKLAASDSTTSSIARTATGTFSISGETLNQIVKSDPSYRGVSNIKRATVTSLFSCSMMQRSLPIMRIWI